MVSPASLDQEYQELNQDPSTATKPIMLVVDDEETARQSLKVIFKDEFEILQARGGAEAIELAKGHEIDVVVLDIRMSGMSGIEVLERLKFIDPFTEVVMMTAFETADTLRQALRLKACDYINKPFDVVTIRESVREAMERRSFGSEVQKNLDKLEKLQEERESLEKELRKRSEDDHIAQDRVLIYDCVFHDISGPLTIISGMLSWLNQQMGTAEKLSGEELDQVKDRLKRITRQVTSCIEVVRRYVNSRNPNPNVKVWVNQVLADLRELVRMNPNSRNHDFVVQPLAEDVVAHIHGVDLIQILLNLTSNALLCTPKQHRVELHCQLLTEPLDLNHYQDGPEDSFLNREGFKNKPPLLAISVQDNGPGIPKEVMPRIFEPHFSSCHNKQAGGTGLGLCIVDRLIRGAHGALHAHSREGNGTVFTVYLSARAGGGSAMADSD